MWRSFVHFVLLGAALFAAERAWRAAEPAPPIVIPAARVAALRADLQRDLGRAPTAAELERAVASEVDDELLFREALARGYERDDPVVFRRLVQNLRFAGAPESRADEALFADALAMRMHEIDVVARRRLVQRMRFDLEGGAALAEPGEAELRARYERDAASYRSEARARFAQLYFRGERAAVARRELARLRAEDAGPEAARSRGDPFLYPAEQPSQTQGEVAGRFGAPFADGVFATEPRRWAGPIASSYGVHLVWVHEREPGRALALDEVRESVRHAVIAERRHEALAAGLAALRADARVVVEPAGGG